MRNKIRDLRKRAGLTTDELAYKAGLSQGYLSKIERGTQRFNADILDKIATALGVSPTELISENEVIDIEPATGNEAMRQARLARNFTLSQLSEITSLSVSYLANLEKGTQEARVSELKRISDALHVPIANLLEGAATEEGVPIIGTAEASGVTLFYTENAPKFERVSAPEWSSKDTVALKIQGSFLGSVFDGWHLFYDDLRQPPSTFLAGCLCVCKTMEDETLVKRLQPASYNLWHLESAYDGTLYGVRLRWASVVKEIRQP